MIWSFCEAESDLANDLMTSGIHFRGVGTDRTHTVTDLPKLEAVPFRACCCLDRLHANP